MALLHYGIFYLWSKIKDRYEILIAAVHACQALSIHRPCNTLGLHEKIGPKN